MSTFTLRVRDFRVIESMDWSPDGVCVLAGANGAGKSTTLDAFKFLRTLFVWGHEAAFRAVDGFVQTEEKRSRNCRNRSGQAQGSSVSGEFLYHIAFACFFFAFVGASVAESM